MFFLVSATQAYAPHLRVRAYFEDAIPFLQARAGIL